MHSTNYRASVRRSVRTSAFLFAAVAAAATPIARAATWEVTGVFDTVTNGTSLLEEGDTFVFRFTIDTSATDVFTPAPTGGTSTYSGALSKLKLSTFPVSPTLEATSGDIIQVNMPHWDTVTYQFDSSDGVTPATFTGQPFASAKLSFLYPVTKPGYPEVLVSPGEIFAMPEWTSLQIRWGSGPSAITATGHVTNLAPVILLVSPPGGIPNLP